jgi:hypothetical protein
VSTDIAVRDEPAGAQLAPIGDPRAHVAAYTAVADELANIVRVKKLATSISGRDHVRVEGWTLLGSMLGVFPVTVWTREMRDDDGTQRGWEARVEARTRDGSIVGAAEAECMRSEKTWRSREDYALRSMAQTRATSKALRQPLGFVMTLAGFDPTPAEEMPRPARAPRPGGSARTGQGAEPTPPPVSDEVLEGEVVEDGTITRNQHAQIAIRVKKLTEEQEPFPTAYKDAADWIDVLRRRLKDAYGVESRKELTGAQADDLIAWLKEQEIPFR